MDTIDLIKQLRDVLQEIFGVNIPDKVMAYIILVIAAGTLLALFIFAIIKLVTWLNSLSQRPWRTKKIRDVLSPDYIDQLKEQKYFISTRFTTSPPHNLDDPLEVERTESAKNLIDHFLDKVLVEDNTTNRFFCILAGAGMGKTTWTVNLVTSYINRYKKGKMPFDIVLISFAHKNFADKVRQIENEHQTILILDALDENVDASNELELFMCNLEQIIQEFRFVIITSRTQFFPSEDAEPYKTNILNLSGDKGRFVFHKMYISPFTQEDVKAFIKKKYSNRKKRREATSIVQRCVSLATRPLLLSHLDDILENERDYFSLYDIYTALIEAWIKREVNYIKEEGNEDLREKLFDFSLNFALELFNRREQSINMRLSRSLYEEFINSHHYTDYNFSGRSLINRDAEGTIKFSHKTFYEYFLARAKFSNPDIELPESGYELAWTFYDQLVHARLKEIPSSHISVIGNDTILCLRRLGSVNFDYRWFNRVVNIKRVGVAVVILDNNIDNFTSWLVKSKVEKVDIIGYKNNNLKKLLSLTNLKEVNLFCEAKLSTKGRQQIRKLKEQGILVEESKLQTYANYSTRYYSRGRDVLEENLSIRFLQESYELFLRTNENALRYLTENIDTNILLSDK